MSGQSLQKNESESSTVKPRHLNAERPLQSSRKHALPTSSSPSRADERATRGISMVDERLKRVSLEQERMSIYTNRTHPYALPRPKPTFRVSKPPLVVTQDVGEVSPRPKRIENLPSSTLTPKESAHITLPILPDVLSGSLDVAGSNSDAELLDSSSSTTSDVADTLSTNTSRESLVRSFYHDDYAKEEDIPFVAVKKLGQGSFGYVDRVRYKPTDLIGDYARKVISISLYEQDSYVAAIQKEVAVIKRLHHVHVVELVRTYRCENDFAIIMLPVADCDLNTFMYGADSMKNEDEKDKAHRLLQKWSGCLLASMVYLHDQRIRHRDIKPANMLVKGDDIYITDFGLAKDLIEEATTGSFGTAEARTPLYRAPETLNKERRGRGEDVFSFGCILLEMASILMGPGLKEFYDFRMTNTKHAYAANLPKILTWIAYLWSIDSSLSHSIHLPDKQRRRMRHAVALTRIAFYMVDPDPRQRIKAHETPALARSVSQGTIKPCADCDNPADRRCSFISRVAPRLPQGVGSEFQLSWMSSLSPEQVLKRDPPSSWPEAKRAWLLPQLPLESVADEQMEEEPTLLEGFPLPPTFRQNFSSIGY